LPTNVLRGFQVNGTLRSVSHYDSAVSPAAAVVRGEGGGVVVARAVAVTHTHVVDVGPHESKVRNRQRLIELLVNRDDLDPEIKRQRLAEHRDTLEELLLENV
jgi:hypothetical protein